MSYEKLNRKVRAGGNLSTALLALCLLAIAAIMVWSLFAVVTAAHADPAPASIYAALQAQRNTCQDQAALAVAASEEELAKVKAELASLKKDFGVQE